MSNTRHTAKGVQPKDYSDTQRKELVAAITGDADFLAQLVPPIVTKLQSGNPELETEALYSVYRFEDRLEYEAQAKMLKQLEAARIEREAANKEASQIERLLARQDLPDDIREDLQSDRSKVRRRGLAKARAVLLERHKARMTELIAGLAPAVDTLRQQLALIHGPMERLKLQKFIDSHTTLSSDVAVGNWVDAYYGHQANLEALPKVRLGAETTFNQLRELLPTVATDERRAKLQSLLDEGRRYYDNAAELQRWSSRALAEIQRQQRKLHQQSQPTKAAPTPGVNWDKQERFQVGRPNANAGPAPQRGQVVSGAGKNSRQLAARKKK